MKINHKISLAISSAIAAALNAQAIAQTAGDSGGIEEVTVTATRRAESIQNVPITMQAITGDQLAQLAVTTFDDVLKLLPNVTFGSNGPGQGNIFMRGLSAGFAGNQSSAAVAPFPNVALYLDDQSMTFPARNADVYMIDMERIEVLEGPQGTLFGGGAEAGAIRYITKKPKLNTAEGNAEATYGTTAHGDPNTAITATINLPLIPDKMAIRASIYNDRRGGYIDNVATTFTRKASDPGPGAYSSAYPASVLTGPSANNYSLVGRAQNPLTYNGARATVLYQFNDDWNALIQQSYQNLDAEGMFEQYPVGSDGQALAPLEVNSFSPVYDHDKYSSTAWTLNGRFGDLRAVYTGAYLTRKIDNTMDYTNYARSSGGFYYSCTGGPAGATNFGAPGPSVCYSPVTSWHDYVENTHQSHELRFTSPDDWRLRALLGGFWEDFRIKDDMNFLYKTIPSCTPANLAAALAPNGPGCLSNVTPINAAIDPTQRNDNVAFGEDLERGYKQLAFFTSLDFDLIPKVLTLTGGTRWYRYTENEDGSQYKTTFSRNCFDVGNNSGKCTAQAMDWASTYTGTRSRGNLTWHVTPDAMLYYTFSQGFRPGAFNRIQDPETKVYVSSVTGQALPNGVPANGASTIKQYVKPIGYPPDSLTNSELGWKTEFFDHRLQVNGSAYDMHWRNVQTLIYSPPVFGNTTFGVQGPDYQIKGFELSFIGRATTALSFQGSMSYNDAKETNSPCIQSAGAQSSPANPTPLGQCITQVKGKTVINGVSVSTNVPVINPLGSVGAVPAFSPKLEFNLRARYDWTINQMQAFFTVGGTHVDKMDNEPSSFTSGEGVAVPFTTWLRYTQPAYNTYDASFGLSKGSWQAQLFGQNLGNSNASLFTSSAQFIRSEVPLRPRVLGLKVGFKF